MCHSPIFSIPGVHVTGNGIPVKGRSHWSLINSFKFPMTFCLIAVDRATLAQAKPGPACPGSLNR